MLPCYRHSYQSLARGTSSPVTAPTGPFFYDALSLPPLCVVLGRDTMSPCLSSVTLEHWTQCNVSFKYGRFEQSLGRAVSTPPFFFFCASSFNIYSTESSVDITDKGLSQKHKQTWTDNMGKCDNAKITKYSRGEEYTRVTFTPDLKRFGMTAIDPYLPTCFVRKLYIYHQGWLAPQLHRGLNFGRISPRRFR